MTQNSPKGQYLVVLTWYFVTFRLCPSNISMISTETENVMLKNFVQFVLNWLMSLNLNYLEVCKIFVWCIAFGYTPTKNYTYLDTFLYEFRDANHNTSWTDIYYNILFEMENTGHDIPGIKYIGTSSIYKPFHHSLSDQFFIPAQLFFR